MFGFLQKERMDFDFWCFYATFSIAFRLFRGGQFFISGRSRSAWRNHQPSIGKLTLPVNWDWSRVHPHERGSNSQPQCWLTTSNYSSNYSDHSATEAPQTERMQFAWYYVQTLLIFSKCYLWTIKMWLHFWR